MGKPSAPIAMRSFASRCPSCFLFVRPRVFPNGGEAAGGTGGTRNPKDSLHGRFLFPWP